MKHQAIAIPGGFAVAYQRHTGQLVAVSEHATRESATREAQRLDLVYQAEMARADRAALRQNYVDKYFVKRSVRFFEDDAFA